VSGPLRPLTKAHAALIRHLLHEKKTRQSEGAFVIEGAHACRDIIQSYPDQILSLVAAPQYLQSEDVAARAARAVLAVPQFTCSDLAFEKLSDVDVPQGIVAVVRQPRWSEADLGAQARLLGVYGERLQDPANVGTIIRTAAALNLTGVWLSPDSVDCFHPKVVRATAGALLALPVFQHAALEAFSQSGCSLYAAVVSSPDAVSIRAITAIPARTVIAVGNESQGLAQETVAAAQVRFTIPLSRGVESLNVAATLAMTAFYFSELPVTA
jgi:TrmH family RNA methyltransferase